MQMRVWNVKVWILPYIVDGYAESWLHFSIDLFWGEVTGQKASTQHTVKTAAAVHPLHTLLKITNNKKGTEVLNPGTSYGANANDNSSHTPSGSGIRSSCSVSCRQAGPPIGSRGCHRVEAKMTTRLSGWRAAVAINPPKYRDQHTLILRNYYVLYVKIKRYTLRIIPFLGEK